MFSCSAYIYLVCSGSNVKPDEHCFYQRAELLLQTKLFEIPWQKFLVGNVNVLYTYLFLVLLYTPVGNKVISNKMCIRIVSQDISKVL